MHISSTSLPRLGPGIGKKAGHFDAENKSLPGDARIRIFALLQELFSQARGELTSTLKVKRQLVAETRCTQLEALYRPDSGRASLNLSGPIVFWTRRFSYISKNSLHRLLFLRNWKQPARLFSASRLARALLLVQGWKNTTEQYGRYCKSRACHRREAEYGCHC